MRDMEIDLSTPTKPVLWVKGHAIQRHGWHKAKPNDIMTEAGLWGPKKQKAMDFYRKYGTTAKNCADFLNKGLIKMSVGAVKGHEPLCYIRSKFSSARTIDVCEMKDELDQAVADGIKNITPFIALYKQNPKQLKQTLGNATWKAICKNSFSRNRGIAEAILNRKAGDDEDKYIETILQTRSGLFKVVHRCGIETANYLNRKCGISVKKINEGKTDVYALAILVADTRRMAEMYGEKFSFDWSWRKMQEKHKEFARIALVKEAERLQAENEKYAKPLREGKCKQWESEGVKATFVDTYLGILEEGDRMDHCVGSYARDCYEDRYAVIHLEGDDEKTTLGILISRVDRHHSIQQHYGYQNEEVKSKKHIALAKHVVDFLNQERLDGVTNERI
jgi:hypothetical protein